MSVQCRAFGIAVSLSHGYFLHAGIALGAASAYRYGHGVVLAASSRVPGIWRPHEDYLEIIMSGIKRSLIKKTIRKSTSPAMIVTIITIGLLGVLHGQNANADGGNSAAIAPSTSAAQSNQAVPGGEDWAVHGQVTNIAQRHATFNSPYSGTNSLSPSGPTEETSDITLFAGMRLWRGAEFWMNAEIDQGFGFNNTLGLAGFSNGGAYKVGENTPYVRMPRAFLRYVIDLGGDEQKIDAAANQLAGTHAANNVTLTVGKFAVVDIFDNNSYAHDPRADFLNWSLIDGGAFDYAADSWGYTFGAAAEWNQDWWTLRAGLFQLSTIPNGKIAGVDFSENSLVVEAEAREQWLGHPGKIKLLAFADHGAMGSYQDAVALGRQAGTTPDVSQVRRVSTRPGVVVNAEQELASDLGAFARYSVDRGDKETYEFADINQSLAGGLALKGARWGRGDDTVGIAGVVNRVSGAAQQYFEAGGLGVLIGDGRLNYAPEKILEMYYAMAASKYATVTLDYQRVTNPAYNQDRGPVSIYAVRLHGSF
jgi:high affinity Mn2+ porin